LLPLNSPKVVVSLICGVITAFGASGPTVAGSSGLASYYTEASCKLEGTSGILTASGERYRERSMTCALPWKPDGKWYKVSGTIGSVYVRHNDMGPGRKPRRRGVIIDLTPAAFKIVCGDLKLGLCEVKVSPV